jgi:very-short-patch-repair endonuclease
MNVQKVFCSNACRVRNSKKNNLKDHNHICEQCGISFVNQIKKTRFCSHICTGVYKNSKGTGKYFNCKECNKKFKQKHGRHFFCSNRCKSLFGIKNTEKVTVACSNCGCDIIRDIYDARKDKNFFCTRKCESTFRENKSNQLRICEFCKKEFKCKKHDKLRFCSMSCQSEWQKLTGFGKNHPSYKHEITDKIRIKKCECCGKDMIGTPRRFETNRYCSYSCKTKSNPRTMSFPHLEVIRILKELNVKQESEVELERYSIDCQITNSNLMIEVMGGFWHCDNRLYDSPVSDIQTKSIKRDAKKKERILSNGFIPIYIWEKDIVENYDVCKKLISYFIERNGKLNNYNSMNYELINGKLKLRNKILVPFFEKQK